MTFTQKLKSHEFNPWGDKRPLLGQLDLELTERCNNACIHCLINRPEHDADARAGEMDTAFVKDILQQAASLGCLTVRFTGGEPLLRDDFAELYLFARRLGMQVILFTNTRRMTPELAQLLARIPPGRVVEVTVYGMHAESYDAVAASRGAFAEFWRGVELLREYNIPFIVKQSVLPPNRHEIAEFEAFAATLPRMEQMPGYAMNFDLRARRDNPAKNRFIQSLRLTPDETVAMLRRDPRYIKGMREFAGKFMGPPGDTLFNCGAGHSTCVDAYGNAQMCMGLRHPGMVYNLRADCHCEERPERSVAESKDATKQSPTSDMEIASQKPLAMTPLKYALTEFFPRLRELRATNLDYLNRCAHCFLKGLCEQCPAKSWQEHGTLDTPVEYLCDVAHAQARYLGLLEADEHAWEIEREASRERVARFAKAED
jgi:MoaA/NifB/PqqE/SkfB family radical SAM enzyme